MSEILSITWTIVKVLYAISIVAVVAIVILQNRNPIKTVTWILVLLSLPGIGLVVYIFFGQSIRKELRVNRKMMKNTMRLLSVSQKRLRTELADNERSTVKIHKNTVLMLTKSQLSVLTANNSVELLEDGQATFKSIIAALQTAKNFIHMEYYIFCMDGIGRHIVDVLRQKCAEGVEVKLLVDDVGSWELSNDDMAEIRSYGIDVQTFMSVRFPKFTSKVNYRNHRKIIVIDGQIGFTGGLNVSDRYIDGGKRFKSWHDMHVKIIGDSVNSLETAFITDWYYTNQEDITDDRYFPVKTGGGQSPVQIATSGPDSDWPTIMMGFFSVIATARKYVYITTPYFMPSETILMALKAAAMSDIDVRILLPKRSDSLITHRCSRSYIKELLRAKVKVYFYTKGFVHAKTIVCDDTVAVVGSANMDFRSFEQNFEASAFIFDSAISTQLKSIFQKDIAQSEQLSLAKWKKRPLTSKVSESLARLFSPVL